MGCPFLLQIQPSWVSKPESMLGWRTRVPPTAARTPALLVSSRPACVRACLGENGGECMPAAGCPGALMALPSQLLVKNIQLEDGKMIPAAHFFGRAESSALELTEEELGTAEAVRVGSRWGCCGGGMHALGVCSGGAGRAHPESVCPGLRHAVVLSSRCPLALLPLLGPTAQRHEGLRPGTGREVVTQGPSSPGCSKARRGQARLGPGCTRGCLLGLGARSHCLALQGAWKRILPSVPEVDESTDFFKSGAASVDVVR